ncbi:hypothetical protein BS50DRAFT_195633 [Corynespora cassiicola Philippines]|uniref:C2H2-type domain-containing protein n=1 Tax=Corynespora cassiicola Philippines TaxID=1448308 RepID=A0A2T2P877_CORCC|nr:hypothetical protein BS50DRAFT_195633 [Corynespora cassiicola Philippines]
MSVSTLPKGRPVYQPYECPTCHSRFTRHENLKRHAALHTRSRDDASLACDFCHATFSRPDLRHRHLKRKHPDQEALWSSKRPRRSPRSPSDAAHPRANPLVCQSQSPSQSHADANADTRPAFQPRSPSDESEVDPDCPGPDHPVVALPSPTPGSSQPSVSHTTPPASPPPDHSDCLSLMIPDTNTTCMDPAMVPFLEPAVPFDPHLHPATTHLASFGTHLANFIFDHNTPDKVLPVHLPSAPGEWHPSPLQVAQGCSLFFDHVSHFVPFLHCPTFDSTQVDRHLLLAMLCLAYQHGEDPECAHLPSSGEALSVRCFHRARALIAIEERKPEEPARYLSMVQAYLLVQVYVMMYLCGDDSTYGLKTHSKMISLSRAGGLVQPISTQPAATSDLASLWRQFIKVESHKRTLYAVHQVDTLWYQFLSIPRSLSHLEIKHDLPCPEEYWTAPSSVEWAHRRLTARQSSSQVQYSDAVRRFLSSEPGLDSIPDFDPYGAINLTQFLISSAREISGWSTMTGMLSLERLAPLRSSLLALGPFIRSQPETAKPQQSALCEATWHTAMIEMQMWSPSHTGGIVEGSIDALLYQLTYLPPCSDFLCANDTAQSIQPHIDWFLAYLDHLLSPDSEAPWTTLYAYKAFMIAWQLLHAGIVGAMQVVRVHNSGEALEWARKVFQRRQRWQLGKIIMTCLDTLEKPALQ